MNVSVTFTHFGGRDPEITYSSAESLLTLVGVILPSGIQSAQTSDWCKSTHPVNLKRTNQMPTLATVSTTDRPSQTVETTMSVLPPGFEERTSRPMVFIGGETEGGQPFYQWNRETSSREYIPTNRFTAKLTDVKLLVKNADDELKRTVKLVCEFVTASGGQVAVSCGAATYSAIGIVAGLNNLSAEQLSRELGLSGKVGKGGRVTFVNVYADGQPSRDMNSEDLLKETRGTDEYMKAVEGFVGDIKAKLA